MAHIFIFITCILLVQTFIDIVNHFLYVEMLLLDICRFLLIYLQ